MRAGETCNNAAAVDVAGQQHRHIGGFGKAHIGDVAGAQIDLRRRSGALDQHDVGLAGETREALQHCRQQGRFLLKIILRPQRTPALALHDDLRAGVGLRLQEHRVHVHARRHPRGARLHRLGAADLAAVDGDRRVVRHVLRLERRDLQPAPHQRPSQSCDQRRLAGIGAGGLDHEGGGGVGCHSVFASNRPKLSFRGASGASRARTRNPELFSAPPFEVPGSLASDGLAVERPGMTVRGCIKTPRPSGPSRRHGTGA